nr:cytochrome P450 2L1-like [Procambarus clarkii]
MVTEALLGLLLLGLLLAFLNKKPKDLPPGVWGWPVVGSLPAKDTFVGDQAKKLRTKYGDIITWRTGTRIFIYLCNYNLIKSAFANPDLQDRPDFYSIDLFTEFFKYGLFNGNGRVWQNSRRLAMRHLKDLGMGKSIMEDFMQREAQSLVADFKKHTGVAQPLPWSINVAVLNVIWKLVSNRRYDVDDVEIQNFNKMITSAFADLQGPVIWFDLIPEVVKFVPNFVNKLTGVANMHEKAQEIKHFMLRIIKEHQSTLDPANPRDYIDAYLAEMEAQKNDPESTLSIQDLWMATADLFIAGTETISSTMRWAILYFAKYPDVQAKAQRELDSVVPRDTLPSLSDIPRLPYLEALTQEIHRVVSITPLGIPHFAHKDTKLAGYSIPKGAVVIPHQECCHTDPQYWDNPERFYPERFIDENGKFFIKKDGFLPFSVGRRICPGESLARMELFFFYAGLLQNFTFSLPAGVHASTEKNPEIRLVNLPEQYDIIIKNRS